MAHEVWWFPYQNVWFSLCQSATVPSSQRTNAIKKKKKTSKIHHESRSCRLSPWMSIVFSCFFYVDQRVSPCLMAKTPIMMSTMASPTGLAIADEHLQDGFHVRIHLQALSWRRTMGLAPLASPVLLNFKWPGNAWMPHLRWPEEIHHQCPIDLFSQAKGRSSQSRVPPNI